MLQPTVTRTQIDRVEYALIWAAPDHSSLEFGRLAVTWMGIVALGAAALYVNQNCNMDLDAMNRGNVARERGDFDSAISEYSEAIRVNSKNVLAYHNRGVAYAQKGDPDQAIANYNEAIRLKWPSKDAVMYQNRGNAYATKGDLDKANADFAKAKKLGYKP